jgi:hypothetical protein
LSLISFRRSRMSFSEAIASPLVQPMDRGRFPFPMGSRESLPAFSVGVVPRPMLDDEQALEVELEVSAAVAFVWNGLVSAWGISLEAVSTLSLVIKPKLH